LLELILQSLMNLQDEVEEKGRKETRDKRQKNGEGGSQWKCIKVRVFKPMLVVDSPSQRSQVLDL
jgi:hypothetical protein